MDVEAKLIMQKPLATKFYLALLLALIFNISVKAQEKLCVTTDKNHLQGAYRLSDGRIISIVPSSTDGKWRYTDFGSGKSHKLYPTDGLDFHSADDWGSETPVVFQFRFNLNKDGAAESLVVTKKGKYKITAKKIKFREQTISFKSGDVQLFGKLTLPMNGKTPFKTVVFVHGSDNEGSVDRDWFPHILAANGIAAFVFDKRGTGCSEGTYIQHFGVLSDDVVAALSWLKTRPEVDGSRIGLAGFSQGGWVAPLAALKDSSVRFVLVGYGMAMSVAEEDRLEAPLKLKEMGLDTKSITQFQELNGALHKVARGNFRDYREFEEMIAKYKDTKWFAVVKGTQSWAGSVLAMGIEQAKVQIPQMFETFFQPFYEPVPTLESLNIPMLWLIAKDDIEAPPDPTIAVLKRLRSEGKPFLTVIFPNTNHGIVEFTLRDGRRVTTKYANDYFSTMMKWIQAQR